MGTHMNNFDRLYNRHRSSAMIAHSTNMYSCRHKTELVVHQEQRNQSSHYLNKRHRKRQDRHKGSGHYNRLKSRSNPMSSIDLVASIPIRNLLNKVFPWWSYYNHKSLKSARMLLYLYMKYSVRRHQQNNMSSSSFRLGRHRNRDRYNDIHRGRRLLSL